MVKFYYIIVLLFCLHVSVKSQSEENLSERFYLGFRYGLSTRMVSESNYIFSLGGSILYNWENNFISASYNRGYTFYIGMIRDKSKYNRYEICYGKVLKLHETHPLFKHLYFTYSIGLSYNVFNFFKDQDVLYKNIANRMEMIGLPIGLAITSRIGKSIYGGVELKFHVFQRINTHIEFSNFIMVNIF